jgi:hypothetical protein
MLRGSRISLTITCCTSLPPPNNASITVNGDNRTGPIPSETSASNTTSTTSPAITLARRRVAMSAVTATL